MDSTDEKFNDVGFAGDDPFKIDRAIIAELQDRARHSDKKRARLCLHQSTEDPIQQMVIALLRNFPVAAHRQVGKRKSYFMLEGSLRVVFFDSDGVRCNEYHLTAERGGMNFLNFSSSGWHACLALTECAVYVETIAGPYRPEQTEWRAWMP